MKQSNAFAEAFFTQFMLKFPESVSTSFPELHSLDPTNKNCLVDLTALSIDS